MTSTTSRTLGAITVTRTAVAAVAAFAANLIVFWIASAADVSFDVDSPQPIGALTVAMFTIIPIALGALVVALIARRAPGFQRFAAWAGLVFALVTTAGSFSAAGDTATALTLSVMHVVVGVAWFFAVRPASRS